MTDHTPTPWTALPDEFGNPTYIIGSRAHAVAECNVGYGIEDDANAAFIVKAVNSHDALVKALTELRNEVSGWLGAYDPDLRQAMGNTNVAVMQDRVANAIAALETIKERA